MSNLLKITVLLFAACLLSVGCDDAGESVVDNGSETETHLHEPGDELVWEVKEKIADTDFEIWFGHHGSHFHAGDTIEPSVAIMKAGEAFADAKVFNQLADPSDVARGLTDEIKTVYEPATDEEIAHYAQGDLKIPADASKCMIRFRIELPGMPGLSRDVTVAVGH